MGRSSSSKNEGVDNEFIKDAKIIFNQMSNFMKSFEQLTKKFFDGLEDMKIAFNVRNDNSGTGHLEEQIRFLNNRIRMLEDRISQLEGTNLTIQSNVRAPTYSSVVSNGFNNQSNVSKVVANNNYSRQFIANNRPVINSSGNSFNRMGFSRYNFFSANRRPSRNLAYRPVEDDRDLLEEKAKNCVIKNLPEDANEEITKVNDLKLVKSILSEANIDDKIVIKVERHPARVPGRSDYRRPLKVFTDSKEHRDLVKKVIARFKRQFLPDLAYVRDDLSPQQLQLDSRLRDKCSLWNMEVGWKRFVVRDLEILDKQTMNLN